MNRERRADIDNVDLMQLGRVIHLSVDCDYWDTSTTNVRIEAEYGENKRIALFFEGVMQFAFGDIHYKTMSFDECFIDDVRKDGLEGIRYQFSDEGGRWSCFCDSIYYQYLD